MDEYTGEELDRLIRSTIADLDVDLAAFLPGPAELAAMLNASLDPEP